MCEEDAKENDFFWEGKRTESDKVLTDVELHMLVSDTIENVQNENSSNRKTRKIQKY